MRLRLVVDVVGIDSLNSFGVPSLSQRGSLPSAWNSLWRRSPSNVCEHSTLRKETPSPNPFAGRASPSAGEFLGSPPHEITKETTNRIHIQLLAKLASFVVVSLQSNRQSHPSDKDCQIPENPKSSEDTEHRISPQRLRSGQDSLVWKWRIFFQLITRVT